MKQSELTPENAALACELVFSFAYHASYSTGAERADKCEYKGMTLWAIGFTRRKGEGFGNTKTTYAIDKEKKVYKDLNEFLDAVRQRTLKIA